MVLVLFEDKSLVSFFSRHFGSWEEQNKKDTAQQVPLVLYFVILLWLIPEFFSGNKGEVDPKSPSAIRSCETAEGWEWRPILISSSRLFSIVDHEFDQVTFFGIRGHQYPQRIDQISLLFFWRRWSSNNETKCGVVVDVAINITDWTGFSFFICIRVEKSNRNLPCSPQKRLLMGQEANEKD